ncbi:MAG: TlpA family protein disulfide reductase [Phycisphaeraceae bacterium]
MWPSDPTRQNRRDNALVVAWLIGLALCLLASARAHAQPRPPGNAPASASDRVVQAHREIASARVEVRYVPYFSYPGETEFVVMNYHVAFDRKANRLRVERPGYTLVCDGKDLLLLADDLPGRHLRRPMDGGLTYEKILEVFADLNDPMPPAVILLLADEPMGWLSGGATTTAARRVPDDAGNDTRTHLRLAMPVGEVRLACDARSRLLDEMTVVIDRQQLAGTDLQDLRFHYGLQWSSVNQPIDDKQFELDLEGSQEMSTLAQFLAPPNVPGNAGPGGADGPGGNAAGGGGTLLGLTLPDMELDVLGEDEPVNLSELDKGVVIVEFFATWTRPSVLDLPALADYKAWCKEKEHSVSVYTVAVGEEPEAMTKWLDALEKTAEKQIDLPVLMDTSTEAAMALKLPTVPRTLVVVDGKIVEVFGGVKPTFLEDLKKATPGWLEKVEPE